jgi:hypothetical protein
MIGSENSHECAENEEDRLGFEVSERYNEVGYENLTHIVHRTGDKTWDL